MTRKQKKGKKEENSTARAKVNEGKRKREGEKKKETGQEHRQCRKYNKKSKIKGEEGK